jgi:Methyl coenzyme M reductase, alpha subunit
MSGGVGFTQYATAAYTDDVLDDFTYYGKEYVEDKYGGLTEALQHGHCLDVGTEVAFYALDNTKNTQHY